MRQDLEELFPVAGHTGTLYPMVVPDPGRFDLPYSIKASLHNVGNAFLGGWGDSKVTEKTFKSIPFVVTFSIEKNEVTDMADIVLPSPVYLEQLDIPTQYAHGYQPTGMHDRCYGIRQPVVSLRAGVRYPIDVIMEIADRLGFLGDLYKLLNPIWRLKDPYQLDPSKKYTWEQMVDLFLRNSFGQNLEWFKQNGIMKNPVTSDVAYSGPTTNARIPIYLEHYILCANPIQSTAKELGMDWDTSDFVALPEWMPCDSYSQDTNDGRDLITVHYKLPYAYGAHQHENSWLNELCERSDYAYGVLINTQTASRKGIKNGDWVRLESAAGSANAKAALTGCIHPEVVGIAGHAGHWAKGMPVSFGNGINYNSLLPYSLSTLDKISTALDHCARVKVSKIVAP
jgi:molybdopterin-containing oxidoreductase family molybdopterin binding subunit